MITNLETIEDFLQGRLPKEEASRFAKEIDNNPAVAEEVAFYLQAKQLGQLDRLVRFETQSKEIRNKKAATRKITLGWSIGIAATLFIAFGVYFQAFRFSPDAYSEEYISQNFAKLPTEMSFEDTSNTMTAFEESILLGVGRYNSGYYEEALGNLNKFKEDPLAIEYIGITQLKQNKIEEALATFKKLAGHTELVQNKGLFYEGITLLRAKRYDEARKVFERVANSTEPLFGKNEAKDILEKW